jgi:hypothetical protein
MGDEVSEGELALKKRREQAVTVDSIGLDDTDYELLEQNKVERERMGEEISELRERSEKRKQEREEEERRLASERAAEDARRRGEEDERKRKKDEEEQKKYYARQQKQAEFEKWKNPPKANFVISKKEAGEEGGEEGDQEEAAGRKSKEQLENEKRAILGQRIKPLNVEGAGAAQLVDKIKELHHLIQRLEGEKYDLEHRYKITQVQLTELADRARQANKVGDGLKRIQGDDNVDRIQTRFAGAPSKVEMYSKYERQKDKRSYDERHVIYTGPQWAIPVERINPTKIVRWSEEGLPIYEEPGAEQQQEVAA